jgi:hypothetical protein
LVPIRIAAGDLTSDRLDDLVVADSLNNRIQIAFQQPDGTFSAPLTLFTGEAPSDIALVDVNGDGLLDIVVTNQASGDVTVFLNDPSHSFATSYRFRAGTSLYGLDTTGTNSVVGTLEQSVSLAAGDFTGDGRTDLVVVNRGAHSFSVLPNDGQGGFGDPQTALTTSTSDGFAINEKPGPVVAGDFNGDGKPDLAILMEDRGEVWIYTGDGHGHFTHTFSVFAGATPTGLSLFRNPQTGLLDLLIGDPFGDILHLQGRGDGTFQLAGNGTSLDVQDLGTGQPIALVANQQTDQVTVQATTAGGTQFTPVQTLSATNPATQLAPGAVQWAKLEGPNSPDFYAVVVASGSDAVLVYRVTGFDAAGHPSSFAPPQTYFVGTDPVSVTIQDIHDANGQGVQDMLIADAGSNQVAILFGSLDANGHWVGTSGPRLNTRGAGPIAVTLRDMNGDGIPDLVVTNAQSGTLTVLPGRGLGNFDDRASQVQVLNIPGNPVLGQGLTVLGSSDSGVVLTATGQLIGVNLTNLTTTGPVFTSPAGQDVTAVQALTDGNLVAAEQGGIVALLAQNAASQTFQDVQNLTLLNPSNGTPINPSDLAVVEGASGLQVVVTNEGADQLFVYGEPAETPPVPPVPGSPTGPEPTGNPPPFFPPGSPGGGTPVGTLNPPSEPPISTPVLLPLPESPLALIATLLTGSGGEVPIESEGSISAANSVPSSGTVLARGDAAAGNREVVSGSEEDGGTTGESERDEQNAAAFQRRIMDLQDNAPQLGPDPGEGRPAMERAPDTEPTPTESPAPAPGEDRPAALDQFFRRWQVAHLGRPLGDGPAVANDTLIFPLREAVSPRAIPALFRTSTPPSAGHQLPGSAVERVLVASEAHRGPSSAETPRAYDSAWGEEPGRLVTTWLSRFEGVQSPEGGPEARSSVAALLVAALAVENLLLPGDKPRRSNAPHRSAGSP